MSSYINCYILSKRHHFRVLCKSLMKPWLMVNLRMARRNNAVLCEYYDTNETQSFVYKINNMLVTLY